MRRNSLIWVTFALAAPFGAQPATAETVAGWQVDGRDDICTMLRPYSPKQPTWIVISQSVNGRQFLRVHDSRWRVVKQQDYAVTLRFDGKSVDLTAKGSITDGVHALSGFVASTDQDWQSNLASASTMAVLLPGQAEAPIDLAGASAAFAAMQTCLQGLKDSGAVALRNGPRIKTGLTLSSSDYPRNAAGAQGRTVIRLTIDPKGKPSRCDVRQSSGNAALDEASCTVALARMRFEPAIATDGTPAEGSFEFPIGWHR